MPFVEPSAYAAALTLLCTRGAPRAERLAAAHVVRWVPPGPHLLEEALRADPFDVDGARVLLETLDPSEILEVVPSLIGELAPLGAHALVVVLAGWLADDRGDDHEQNVAEGLSWLLGVGDVAHGLAIIEAWLRERPSPTSPVAKVLQAHSERLLTRRLPFELLVRWAATAPSDATRRALASAGDA